VLLPSLLFAAISFCPAISSRSCIYCAECCWVPITARIVFRVSAGTLPHTPDSYNGRIGHGRNRIDLYCSTVVRIDLLHFSIRIAEEGLPDSNHHDSPYSIPSPPSPSSSCCSAENRLFMPVLYIIFGMPVKLSSSSSAFTSWGMTWSFRSAKKL